MNGKAATGAVVLACLAAGTAGIRAEPAFTLNVEALDVEWFELTIRSSSPFDYDDVQGFTWPIMRILCGDDAVPDLGKFELSAPIKVADPSKATTTYKAQFGCESVLDIPQGPSRILDEDGRRAVRDAVQARTLGYFAGIDSGDHRQSFAMQGQELGSSFEEWKQKEIERRETLGGLLSRDVWRVTVYADPDSAPRPGIYIATDYEEYFTEGSSCGYLVWLERPDRTYQIIRHEHGDLPNATREELTPEQKAKFRRLMNCRQP